MNVGLRYTDVLNPCYVRDRTSRNGSVLLLSFFIVNCIEGLIEFTRSSRIWTSSWCGQSIKVSSTYLNHIVGFRDIDSNAISSKYSIYIFAIAGDNGEPIAKPVNICVIPFRSVLFVYRESTSPSDYLLEYWSVFLWMCQRPICPWLLSASSESTLVNKHTTSKLIIWLDRMGTSLIISTKWDEFLTYEGDFPINGSIISTRRRLGVWHT